jgi:hypothetical protein
MKSKFKLVDQTPQEIPEVVTWDHVKSHEGIWKIDGSCSANLFVTLRTKSPVASIPLITLWVSDYATLPADENWRGCDFVPVRNKSLSITFSP